MYQLERTKKSYRKEPWRQPYQERIGTLKTARKSGRRTAAFLYPYFDSSTFRYRAYNTAQTLEYSLWWSGAYFVKEDLKELWKDLACIDVLMVIRCGWTKTLEEFLTAAKERGIRLCYDIDDLVCHPRYMPDIIEAVGITKDEKLDFWFGQTERNRMILQMCETMSTTNKYLGRLLKKDFDKPCYILKNYLNWAQEDVSESYFAAKQALKPQKPFIIGYFSGSPTHVRDLMMVMPQLEEFLSEHEDSVLQIVGYMEFPKKYEYLVQKEKIRCVPFQTFIGLQYEQAVVDVNIVPLVNNDFSNCKSELKYFESAIVGTVTCAAPVYSYKKAITDGENGYLCQGEGWMNVLKQLYEEDDQIRRKRQQHIKEQAMKNYSHKKQVLMLEELMECILGGM